MKLARREFLKTLGTASVASTVLGLPQRASPGAWEAIGPADFDFADDRVPMNSANLCPMPSEVSTAVANFQRQLDTDMSAPSRARIEQLKEEARDWNARLLGVTADEIAFVRNTSEANNVIVQGLPLESGDEVLLWEQNHPSNGVAWKVRAKRSACSVRYLSIPTDPGSIDEVVATFTDAIGSKTRIVSFTHISNITGFRLPAKEICAAIRAKADVHIHIDGAQTWGAVDMDLAQTDCDSFSGSAHKWFMGPREVGLLYVNERSIDKIWPSIVSVPWGDDEQTSAVGARKFEALGQRDDAAIAGLMASSAIHDQITPAGIERQSMQISDYLRDRLQSIGVPFASPLNPNFTSSVVILKANSENAFMLAQNVLVDGGIITAATGGFRMSPHVYNTSEHIDRVVAAVAKSRHLLAPG